MKHYNLELLLLNIGCIGVGIVQICKQNIKNLNYGEKNKIQK